MRVRSMAGGLLCAAFLAASVWGTATLVSMGFVDPVAGSSSTASVGAGR